MTEIVNPSEKSQDLVTLLIVGAIGFVVVKSGVLTTIARSIPGSTANAPTATGTPVRQAPTAGAPAIPSTTPTTGSNAGCAGFDVLITAADTGGNPALANWIGRSFRDLYNATYPSANGGAGYAHFIADGHHC